MRKFRFFVLCLLTAAVCAVSAMAVESDGWLLEKQKDAPTFADVKDTWCENYVATVYASGLMTGKTESSFDAVSPLTHAQITVIAARLYDLLTGGDGVIAPVPDAPWYRASYDLLVDAGVLAPNDPGSRYEGLRWYDSSANTPCRRQFFVELLGTVLEKADVTLPALNQVSLIPDLADDKTGYIHAFYNYGILNGADAYGGFHASSQLSRGAAAAMLVRIIDPAERLRFTLPSFDICTDLLEVKHEDVLLIVDGTEITAEQLAHPLASSLSTAYPTPEVGLERTIDTAVKQIAAQRLMEELGYSVDPVQLKDAGALAEKQAGLLGSTAEGHLWEEMSSLYRDALSPYILGKYADKGYTNGMEQEIRAKADTLTVIRPDLLCALDLSALQKQCKTAPVFWG